jgi:hypothetical protein
VKIRDAYTDWRVTAGLALVLLGATNWAVGLSRTQTYSQIVATARERDYATDIRSFDELDATAGAVLEPFTNEERQVSFATARMDFYHATYLAGRVMAIGGLLLAFWGFIRVIQKDSRRAVLRARNGDSFPSSRALRSSGRDG